MKKGSINVLLVVGGMILFGIVGVAIDNNDSSIDGSAINQVKEIKTEIPKIEPEADVVEEEIIEDIDEKVVEDTIEEESVETETYSEPIVESIPEPAPIPVVEPEPEPAPVFESAPTPVPEPEPEPTTSCCKMCSTGKACGDSCISKSYTCHKPPGCACNAY
ncbi:MAG: hypothetical protein ABIE68_03555 [bacterium]